LGVYDSEENSPTKKTTESVKPSAVLCSANQEFPNFCQLTVVPRITSER